jgi:hypothetical protein
MKSSSESACLASLLGSERANCANLLARDLGWEELLTFPSFLSLVLSSDLEDGEVGAFFADGVRFLQGIFLFNAAHEIATKSCFAILSKRRKKIGDNYFSVTLSDVSQNRHNDNELNKFFF